MPVRRSARRNSARRNSARRNSARRNSAYPTVDQRTMYMRQIEELRHTIRSIITDPRFNFLIIPAIATLLANNQTAIHYDTIMYRDRFIWAASTRGSPYKDDLPIYPAEDEVVDYVTIRILNGTYKFTPGNYINDNAIVYSIGGVKHIIQ